MPTGATRGAVATPRGHPIGTTATGSHPAREPEGATGLPGRPQRQRGADRAEARGRGRELEVLDRGEHRPVERGRADRGKDRAAAPHARNHEHGDVLEVVGFPLARIEGRVLAAARAEHPLVDRPSLPVRARELMTDVRIADDDELAAPVPARVRVLSKIEEGEQRVVVDGIRAQPPHRHLRAHHGRERRVEPPRNVVEGRHRNQSLVGRAGYCGTEREEPEPSLRHSAR